MGHTRRVRIIEKARLTCSIMMDSGQRNPAQQELAFPLLLSHLHRGPRVKLRPHTTERLLVTIRFHAQAIQQAKGAGEGQSFQLPRCHLALWQSILCHLRPYLSSTPLKYMVPTFDTHKVEWPARFSLHVLLLGPASRLPIQLANGIQTCLDPVKVVNVGFLKEAHSVPWGDSKYTSRCVYQLCAPGGSNHVCPHRCPFGQRHGPGR